MSNRKKEAADPYDFQGDVQRRIAEEKKRVAADHGMSASEIANAARAALQGRPFLRIVSSESGEQPGE